MSEATILIVDDHSAYIDTYSRWLPDTYETRTAIDGQEGIQQLDPDIDVVLLDRRMPRISGRDVLRVIENRHLPCRVAIVSAVEPDFDIIEMGLDEYVVKPITETELTETVKRLLRRAEYSEQAQDLFALVSKKVALDAQTSLADRRASERYAQLKRDIAESRKHLDETVEQMDTSDFRAAYRDLLSKEPRAST